MTDDNSDERGTGTKILLTAIIGIAAVPGLVVEPGPLTEMTAVALILGVWGLDLDSDGGGS